MRLLCIAIIWMALGLNSLDASAAPERWEVIENANGMAVLVEHSPQLDTLSFSYSFPAYIAANPQEERAVTAEVGAILDQAVSRRLNRLMKKGGLTASDRSETLSMLDSWGASARRDGMPFLAEIADGAKARVASLPGYPPPRAVVDVEAGPSDRPANFEAPPPAIPVQTDTLEESHLSIPRAQPGRDASKQNRPLMGGVSELPAETANPSAGKPAPRGIMVAGYTYTVGNFVFIVSLILVGVGMALGLSDTAIFYRNGWDMLISFGCTVLALAGYSAMEKNASLGVAMTGVGLGLMYYRSSADNGWLMALPLVIAKGFLSMLVLTQLTSLASPDGVTRRERAGNQVAALVWLTLLSSLAWALRNGERVRAKREGLGEIAAEA